MGLQKLVRFGQYYALYLEYLQGCHGEGKMSGKRNIFQVREKSGNFVDGQVSLERTWKVREMSGNLKIDSYGSLQKIIYSVQKGKGCTFS